MTEQHFMPSQLSKSHAADSRSSQRSTWQSAATATWIFPLLRLLSQYCPVFIHPVGYVLAFYYSRDVRWNVRRSEFKLLFSVKLVRTSYDYHKLWGDITYSVPGWPNIARDVTLYPRRPRWRWRQWATHRLIGLLFYYSLVQKRQAMPGNNRLKWSYWSIRWRKRW